MRKIFFFVCALAFAQSVWAAQEFDMDNVKAFAGYKPVAPHTAVISPAGARLEVSQKAEVRAINGKSVVEFVLPPDSTNLQLVVKDHAISRWSSTPALLNQENAGRKSQIEKAKVELTAQLMTVNARLALWQAIPQSATALEIKNLQTAMEEEMPQLVLRQSGLEKRLKLINEELSRMPQGSGIGERVRVVLVEPAREGEELELNYSYQHDSCGWEAVYDFNAKPDEGAGDEIDVRLLAEVWQFTGLDWQNTKITLATRGFGPREPKPLPEWVIDSERKMKPQPRAMMAMNRAAVATEVLSDEAPAAGVAVDTDTVYATWQLRETGLPQGRSRLQITAQAWKAPLQWLARPSKNSSQVWLQAKYDLPADQAWPSGQAQYNVNGQSVGNGYFRPESGEATLFFGSDPRVTITTTTDAQKRGQSGFIRTSKTWTWDWTYTITNQHNKPVTVKVERPTPLIVDQDVTVAYNNIPKAEEDNKKHMLVWTVTAPANGKIAIQHDVTISSPTKLPLLPDIP